jgi:lipoyl(octanoyl) transferase
VRDFIFGLEESLLMTLEAFGVEARRKAGAPGIWTDDVTKIASIGVRVRNFVTTHGVSLNVKSAPDASQFITVCGMPEIHTSSVESISGSSPDLPLVSEKLTELTAAVFGLNLDGISLQDLLKILGRQAPSPSRVSQ